MTTCQMNNLEIEWSLCSALMWSFLADWAQSTNYLSWNIFGVSDPISLDRKFALSCPCTPSATFWRILLQHWHSNIVWTNLLSSGEYPATENRTQADCDDVIVTPSASGAFLLGRLFTAVGGSCSLKSFSDYENVVGAVCNDRLHFSAKGSSIVLVSIANVWCLETRQSLPLMLVALLRCSVRRSVSSSLPTMGSALLSLADPIVGRDDHW